MLSHANTFLTDFQKRVFKEFAELKETVNALSQRCELNVAGHAYVIKCAETIDEWELLEEKMKDVEERTAMVITFALS